MRIANIILLSAPAVHVGLDIFKDDLRLAQVCADQSCSPEIAQPVVYAGEYGRQDWLGGRGSIGCVRLESPGIVNIAASLLSRPDTSAQGDTRSSESSSNSSSQSSHSTAEDVASHLAHSRQSSSGFEKAAVLAKEYQEELGVLKRMLRERGIELPQPRFSENDAEVMRYAVTTGLTSARTAVERQRAIESAAVRVEETLVWLSSHKFSTEAEVRRWEPMLYWLAEKEVGHPVLVIDVAKATKNYYGDDLDDFGESVVTQVEASLRDRLSDAPGEAEQMVVIADCGVASSKQGSYVLKIMKHVSLALNRHYPGRLYRFYMVNLPRLVRWPVKAIISLGHPSTREKIIFCSADDPRLPAGYKNSQ